MNLLAEPCRLLDGATRTNGNPWRAALRRRLSSGPTGIQPQIGPCKARGSPLCGPGLIPACSASDGLSMSSPPRVSGVTLLGFSRPLSVICHEDCGAVPHRRYLACPHGSMSRFAKAMPRLHAATIKSSALSRIKLLAFAKLDFPQKTKTLTGHQRSH